MCCGEKKTNIRIKSTPTTAREKEPTNLRSSKMQSVLPAALQKSAPGPRGSVAMQRPGSSSPRVRGIIIGRRPSRSNPRSSS